MKSQPVFCNKLRLLLLATIAWACTQGLAWAQGINNSGGTGVPGGLVYVTSYAVVLLGIFLGVFSVVIPARRRERAKQDAFADRTK